MHACNALNDGSDWALEFKNKLNKYCKEGTSEDNLGLDSHSAGFCFVLQAPPLTIIFGRFLH